MIYRLRAFALRVWRVPYLVEGIVLVAFIVAALATSGCGSIPLPATPSADVLQKQLADTRSKLATAESDRDGLTGEVKTAHQRSVEAERAEATARGLYEQSKLETKAAHTAEETAKTEARLAPIRTILLIVSIAATLVAIAGLVVFALSFVPTLMGFGRTIGLIAGVGGLVGLIGAQLVNAALSHLALIMAGFVGTLAVAFVAWLIWDRHQGQKTSVEGLNTGDDAIARLEEMGKTSVEAAVHAAAVKAAAIARQEAHGIRGRIDASLTHVRSRLPLAAAKAP